MPLTEFMKALGQPFPVYVSEKIWRYNAPYRQDDKASMLVNVNRNTWEDPSYKWGGNIFDLAEAITGSRKVTEQESFIASVYRAYQLSQGEKRLPSIETVNGDRIDAVALKGDDNQWMLGIRVNGEVKKPEKLEPYEAWQMLAGKVSTTGLMLRHFPELMEQRSVTPDFVPYKFKGMEDQVWQFGLEMRTDGNDETFGRPIWTAMVGNKKIWKESTEQEICESVNNGLNGRDLFIRVFGQELGLPEYYEKFVVPEDAKIIVGITYDRKDERYKINARNLDTGRRFSAPLNISDYRASEVTFAASRHQLAMKYFGNDLFEDKNQEKGNKENESVRIRR